MTAQRFKVGITIIRTCQFGQELGGGSCSHISCLAVRIPAPPPEASRSSASPPPNYQPWPPPKGCGRRLAFPKKPFAGVAELVAAENRRWTSSSVTS